MTPDKLRELLDYDPNTGFISWRGARNKQQKGERALCTLSAKGFFVGSILNRSFNASRVAWAIYYGEWPVGAVTCINGDKTDLRICNLKKGRARLNAQDRFVFYVAEPNENGCMEWQGGLSRGGYGKFRPSPETNTVGAHRFAYEMANGSIPEGMFVCHTCDNRKCCNPDHLWLGTHNDNVQDMLTKGRHIKLKSHCRHGHEMTNENRKKLHGRLTNRCKECSRIAVRKNNAKIAALASANRKHTARK